MNWKVKKKQLWLSAYWFASSVGMNWFLFPANVLQYVYFLCCKQLFNAGALSFFKFLVLNDNKKVTYCKYDLCGSLAFLDKRTIYLQNFYKRRGS